MPPAPTIVSIQGEDFHINGRVTYEGRTWRGYRIEGLLLNSRMVQGVFDDRNGETRSMWDFPDGPWDAERNTDALVAAMSTWRAHGLLAFDVNFQGGNPQGYGRNQPWHNSAYETDGTLRDDYAARMARILDEADRLGMVVMLGFFYFGQDQRLRNEAAVIRAADAATDWLLDGRWRNVIVEINNEANVRYSHEILTPGRVDELIRRVQQRSQGKVDSPSGRLPAATSMGGGAIPPDNIVAASDILLLHGNGVEDPSRIREMVRTVRETDAYRGRPVVFNEDDHYRFDEPDNNFVAAVSEHASWGFFDYRRQGEPFEEGYQSVPCDWGISSDRKKAFFGLVAEMTGATESQ
jgi:hypothetical protein